MKQKRMLTLTAFGSALLIWSLVCHTEPTTAEPPRSPDCTAKASRSSDGNTCPKALKGKYCAANATKGCSAKPAQSECGAANAAKGCSAVKGKNRPCPPVKQASCGASLDATKAAERLKKIGYRAKRTSPRCRRRLSWPALGAATPWVSLT